MDLRLAPDRPLDEELPRLVCACLDDAVVRLERLGAADADPVDAVHQIRKRCKEVRGLARLVRPALGPAYGPFNAEVRDAARALSPLRDAHALLGTVESLQQSLGGDAHDELAAVRDHQTVLAHAATEGLDGDDARVVVAAGRLALARSMAETWDLPRDPDVLRGGLARTYRDGRRALGHVVAEPDDHRVHEWRKRVKDLWYAARALEAAEAVAALVDDLDQLSDLLGEDHDLAVLADQLDGAVGADALAGVDVGRVARLARERQAALRAKAIALGRRVYRRKPKRFVASVVDPWRAVAAAHAEHRTTERERTFLVAAMPDLPTAGTHVRQGYLALDGAVAVRIRERRGQHVLTLKGGHGSVRTELEWSVEPGQFEAAWPLTDGRRIDKTRYEVPVAGGTAELDVFAGELTGLVLVEVEFDSDEAMAAFEPPPWFGPEVTDDERYSNAALATDGLQPGMVVGGG